MKKFMIAGALALCALCSAPGASAQNLMELGDSTVAPGSTFTVNAMLTNVNAIAGYTIVTTFDPALFTASGADVGQDIVSTVGPVAGPGENGGIEFLSTNLDSSFSTLAVIFDLNFPFDGQTLAAGGPRSVAQFQYTLVNDPMLIGMTLNIDLTNNVGSPPLSNVISEVGGFSVFPNLIGALVNVVDLPSFLRGDTNNDGIVNIADGIATIGWLFQGAAAPNCLAAVDINADTLTDISDIIFLVTWQFQGGPQPQVPYPNCGIDGVNGSTDCDFSSCP